MVIKFHACGHMSSSDKDRLAKLLAIIIPTFYEPEEMDGKLERVLEKARRRVNGTSGDSDCGTSGGS